MADDLAPADAPTTTEPPPTPSAAIVVPDDDVPPEDAAPAEQEEEEEEEEAPADDAGAALTRTISKQEDSLQVQLAPDPHGPTGGPINMCVDNRTGKRLLLSFLWNGSYKGNTPVPSGEQQTAKTYHGAEWRISEAHHESSAIEWAVDKAHGANQVFEVTEKQEDSEEEDPEDVAGRLARGKSLIDDLRGSASAAGGFDPSPGTDESLSPKMLADRPDEEQPWIHPVFNGLPNPSNYCFLNATIQCLRHTPYLASRITAAAPSDPSTSRFREQHASLLTGFAALLRRMEAGGDPIGTADAKRQCFISACSTSLPPDAISGLPLVQTGQFSMEESGFPIAEP